MNLRAAIKDCAEIISISSYSPAGLFSLEKRLQRLSRGMSAEADGILKQGCTHSVTDLITSIAEMLPCEGRLAPEFSDIVTLKVSLMPWHSRVSISGSAVDEGGACPCASGAC